MTVGGRGRCVENSLRPWILSYNYVVPWDGTPAIRLGCKHLYPLSCLPGPGDQGIAVLEGTRSFRPKILKWLTIGRYLRGGVSVAQVCLELTV